MENPTNNPCVVIVIHNKGVGIAYVLKDNTSGLLANRANIPLLMK